MSALPSYPGRPGHHRPEYSNNEPAELAGSDIPAELSGDAPPPSSSQPGGVGVGVGAGPVSPQTHDATARQDFFPPPPPGPPTVSSPSWTPATGHAGQQQGGGAQEYYPPPPPGPPPNHHHQQQHQYQAYVPADQKLPPPSPLSPEDYDAPPPSYAEEFGDGPPLTTAGAHDADAKTSLPPPPGPPKLPPRPVSSGMYFPPPPASPSQAHKPGAGAGVGEGLAGKHGGAAAATSGGGSSGGGGGSDYGSGGFGEKLYRWGVKAGVPVNKIAHKFGSEAFWPMTMDLECDKAARILKGFCSK